MTKKKRPDLDVLVSCLKKTLSNIASTDLNRLKECDIPWAFRRLKVSRAEDKVIVFARLYGLLPNPPELRAFILKSVANLQKNDGRFYKSTFVSRLLEDMRDRYQSVTDEFLDSVIPLVPKPPKPPKKGIKGISYPGQGPQKPP
ncbi:hypothetical protein HYV44_02780 [Candidatus Microgenomates bacterium]|nr:hypothetical protein [Candidatus Microgenomates bacterium]